MRIYMQMPPTEDKAPRFYQIYLQPDLLEGWSLVKEWGYQGAGGRVTKEHFIDRSDAEQAMMATRDSQLKRGYRVVFMEGQREA